MKREEQICIIGAGPAGIAAALQLSRYGINPILLEKNEIGGLLRNAHLVENYPGFPGGISGPELVKLFVEQLQEREVKVILEAVTKLDWEENRFRLETPTRVSLCQMVLVASGTKPTEFQDFEVPLPVRDKVFYEVYPLLEAKEKKIVIIGAGDAAFDYALNLAQNNQVIILNREETVKCLPLLRQRAKLSPSITYRQNTKILKLGQNSSDQFYLECVAPEGIFKLSAHHLVFAIGREPQLEFLSQRLRAAVPELLSRGVLYFAGDVKNGSFRQTAIATGEGVLTAMKIYKKLQENSL